MLFLFPAQFPFSCKMGSVTEFLFSVSFKFVIVGDFVRWSVDLKPSFVVGADRIRGSVVPLALILYGHTR